jgi:hypothetical protein
MAGASTCPFWSSLSRSGVEVLALKKASQFLVISAFAAAGSAGWEPADDAEALADGDALALGDAEALGPDDGELLAFDDALLLPPLLQAATRSSTAATTATATPLRLVAPPARSCRPIRIRTTAPPVR